MSKDAIIAAVSSVVTVLGIIAVLMLAGCALAWFSTPICIPA
jgi:hypothetical protein